MTEIKRLKNSVKISGKEWRIARYGTTVRFAKFCLDTYKEDMEQMKNHLHDDFLDALRYTSIPKPVRLPWYLRLYNTVRGWFR